MLVVFYIPWWWWWCFWCWWYSTYLGGGGGASGVGGIPHTLVTTLTLSDLQPNLVGAQVEFNLTQYHRRLELLEKSLQNLV